MQPMYSFSSVLGFTLLLTFGAAAQTQTIKIWPGTAPGSENWTEKEDVMKSADTDRVINVTTPTLTVGGNMDDAGKYGMADGIQALKVVRQRAGEWGLSPDRIGIVGFSAGAMVASAVLLQEEAPARPTFAAPIYGGPFGAMPIIPPNLPPVFLAWAQDDALAGRAVAAFYTALKAAGNDPEVHIYRSGGHGFGMAMQGTTSDHWIDEFYYWLEAQGLTKPAAK